LETISIAFLVAVKFSDILLICTLFIISTTTPQHIVCFESNIFIFICRGSAFVFSHSTSNKNIRINSLLFLANNQKAKIIIARNQKYYYF